MVGVVHGNMGSKITKVVDDLYADVSSGCGPGLVDDCRISASDTRSAVSPTAATHTRSSTGWLCGCAVVGVWWLYGGPLDGAKPGTCCRAC